MRQRLVRSLLFLLAFALSTTASVLAQQNGSVTGTVRDVGNGTPVAAARVEVVGADGRVVGTTTTNAQGRFEVMSVPPGRYTVVVSGERFEARRVDAQVSAGRPTAITAEITTGNVVLDPLVISASKAPEKALEAPARVEVISEREIESRPAVSPVDHLRAVAGVDVAQTGVQSTNVVARGFNNIFSGALHTLTDYRMAGIPSLRVNFLHFIPSNNQDMQRMEVVLGPGAALYGPNTANGILHILTKSPLDEQGTTVSLGGGQQSTFQGEFRTAHAFSDRFGIKLSGQYLQSEEWRYDDPVEAAERQNYDTNLALYRGFLMQAAGITQAEADERIARVARRDFDVQRYGGELRADWRVAPEVTAVFQAGMTNAASAIELTGLGASQVKDWRYSYVQARASWRRLFAQVYQNQSDAGDTYLLRNGAPITDRSRVTAAQVQHGFDLGSRQSFTYGADYTYTNPVTGGSINGKYENDDETTEYGAYLQSETAVAPWMDLVLAGRIDHSSAIPDVVFSPRAAVVFKPMEGQAIRFSYNRAFTTPSSLNQFLDLGSVIPGQDDRSDALRRLGYSLRIQGTGEEGFSFGDPSSFMVRSPFTPGGMGGPGQLLPAAAIPGFYPAAVQVLAAQGAIPPALAAYLGSLNLGGQVGLSYVDLLTGDPHPLSELTMPDIEPIRESLSTTLEAGYKGILANRVLLAADLWWSRKEDLVTPLTIQTPLVFLNGQQLGAFLVPRLMTDLGMSQQQATAVVTGLASVPLGVISSADVNANSAQLLVTYVNVDETLDVWGTDLSARVLISDEWSVAATGSWVNRDYWDTESAGLVTLNAPRRKASLSALYANDDTGLSGELRVRHTSGFPVNSGVYVGTLCVPDYDGGPLAEPCVKDYSLVDLNLGYRIPLGRRNTTLQVSVSNLFDEDYRPFPGVPRIGRMVLARVRYDF